MLIATVGKLFYTQHCAIYEFDHPSGLEQRFDLFLKSLPFHIWREFLQIQKRSVKV